jgi:hypothetical protein
VTARDRIPPQVRAAGALVAGQGLAALGFGVFLVAAAGGAALSLGAVLGEAALFAIVGIVLAALGIGLVRGGRGARTPAIVVQLLLLPVVYSLIGPSQQLVAGIVTGVYVVATFLLLISEPSRRWAVAPYDRAP